MQQCATTSATVTLTMAKNFVVTKSNFGGIDQRAGCASGVEAFPELVNFKINQSGHLEKREGFALFDSGDGSEITRMWSKSGTVLAAKGKDVLRLENESFNFLGKAARDVSGFFRFCDRSYALGGKIYHADITGLPEIKGYVPLVATACAPDGAGTPYEKVNLINPNRRVQFNGDGVSKFFTLPEKNISSIFNLTVNGEKLNNGFFFPSNSNVFELEKAPPEGINNVSVSYYVDPTDGKAQMINKCRFAVVFENRVFLYGNPDYPNYVFYSENANGMPSAEYFTETNCHIFDKPVRSLCACYNRLIIFCEDCAYYTHGELKTDSIGRLYTSFPLFELNADKGSIAEGNMPIFNNMPVTLCDDGINRWVSTAIADERTAKLFSERVYKHALDIKEQKSALKILNRKAFSELWFVIPTGVLIYNYAGDCFYYYDIPDISALCEYGKGVLFGRNGNIYLYSEEYTQDDGADFKAEFATPYCTFGAPYTLKNLNGAGLTVKNEGALLGDLTLSRGNITEEQNLHRRLVLPPVNKPAYRLTRCRLHLKRFYSCKLVFCTYSPKLCITELSMFGKQLTGFTRNN